MLGWILSPKKFRIGCISVFKRAAIVIDLIFFKGASYPYSLLNPKVSKRPPADTFTGPIGKYGRDSWMIFQENTIPPDVTDKKLKEYIGWLKKSEIILPCQEN